MSDSQRISQSLRCFGITENCSLIGLAVIFSFEVYDPLKSGEVNPKNRTSGGEESINLEIQLVKRGFKVVVYKDRTDQEVKDIIGNICQNEAPMDAFVCVVMSHGSCDCEFLTANNKTLHVRRDIIHQIGASRKFDNCFKLYINNFCRTDDEDDAFETDTTYSMRDSAFSTHDSTISTHFVDRLTLYPGGPTINLTKTMVVYSTIRGDPSFRDAQTGAVFIKCLVETLNDPENAKKDMISLLDTANIRMSKEVCVLNGVPQTQCLDFHSTILSPVYLYPQINKDMLTWLNASLAIYHDDQEAVDRSEFESLIPLIAQRLFVKFAVQTFQQLVDGHTILFESVGAVVRQFTTDKMLLTTRQATHLFEVLTGRVEVSHAMSRRHILRCNTNEDKVVEILNFRMIQLCDSKNDISVYKTCIDDVLHMAPRVWAERSNMLRLLEFVVLMERHVMFDLSLSTLAESLKQVQLSTVTERLIKDTRRRPIVIDLLSAAGTHHVSYPDGSIYIGGVSEQNRDGDGLFSDINGDRYDGQWFGDLKHGVGTCNYADGSRYEGEWVNGQTNGQGTLFNPDGTPFYTGLWLDGNQHGQGIMTFPDGSTFEGNWFECMMNGSGIVTDGAPSAVGSYQYRGRWVAHRPHGEGVLFAGGRRYDGSFERGFCTKGRCHYSIRSFYIGDFCGENKRCGYGEMTYNNGDHVECMWDHDVRKGPGTYTFANGGKVTGYYVNDEFHGNVTFHDVQGNEYVGGWMKGRRQGRGIQRYVDGYHVNGVQLKKYSGFFHKDKFDGLDGELIYATGEVYRGAFVHGWRHGEGTLIDPSNGHRYVGSWYEDQMDGHGVYHFTENSYYDGLFCKNKRDGKGVYVDENGVRYKQEYVCGELKVHGGCVDVVERLLLVVKSVLVR